MDISYNSFKKQVLDNLVSHLKNQFPDTSAIIPGLWPRHHVTREHILKIENGQMNAIKDYNLLKSVMTLPFLLSEKQLHQYAHHLNSSQIMCYNFFRPQLEQINDEIHIKEPLYELLNHLPELKEGRLSSFSNNDFARFEYEEMASKEPERKTNFDFFVKVGKTKIYFEIKYTENGFGSCDYDDNHKNKFNDYYKGLMKDCGIFNEDVINWNKIICKYYQLIRNAINVGENAFVVIITDERNKSTNKQIELFGKQMLIKSSPYYRHLIYMTWQEMVELAQKNGFSDEHLREFRKKYLK